LEKSICGPISKYPPENAKLLEWLERELVASHYDLKHIFRLILNSSVYQLSAIPRADRAAAAAHFAAYPLRRMDAEVLSDALDQITGTSEAYSSAIPEPYTFMPDFQRSIVIRADRNGATGPRFGATENGLPGPPNAPRVCYSNPPTPRQDLRIQFGHWPSSALRRVAESVPA